MIRALRRLVPFVVAGGFVAWGTRARAQAPSPAARADELKTLEKNLADESATLSTSDCATACRALGSIRRAADKICALDPDERCVAARAKADDATRRVREACPECVAAVSPTPPAPKSPTNDRAATKGGAPTAESVQTAGAAPPAESRRGGCAGCTTTGSVPAGDLAGGVLAFAALAFVLRRRRDAA